MISIKILVIEGGPFFTAMLVRFIQQTDAGFVVDVRKGTLESLLVDLDCWAPDVLLLDLDTPGLKNLSRISQARKTQPEVIIIVMGIFDDVSYRALAVGNSADDYLSKDDLPNLLFSTIQYHLSSKITV
ncbi:MAG: response regulator [Anaerolineaceae bacterium]|nr:response regulator [Anaerolineaceae bacterium]